MRDKECTKRALRILLFFLSCQRVTAQLDSENAILGVYMDTSIIQGQQSSMEELVKKTGLEASSQMEKGSLSVRILTFLQQAVRENLTAVLTVTDCDKLQMLAPEIINAERLHIAITDAGCMRVRGASTMTVPLVGSQNDVVQLIADLREKNTLIWTDIVIIHDGTLDPHNLDLVMSRLSLPTDSALQTSVIVIDISKVETASKMLGTVLNELRPRPGEPKEKQFLVIVSRKEMETIQNIANTMNLMSPKYQWLYVVPDSHSLNYDMVSYLKNMKDGDNMAFVYNMSDQNPEKDCKTGVSCYLDTLIRQYAIEYSKELKNELETYFQVSEEEWEEIKPSQRVRAEKVIKGIKIQQETMPSCAICTRWGIQAAEVRAADRIELLNVANWLPVTGLLLFDDIFPHITGGFRKRVIVLTSVHYPPWQIFERDGTYSGLIFEVVKTLGERLNFSFVVRSPPDGQWGTKMPSGVWSGMIEMIKNKEAQYPLLGTDTMPGDTSKAEAVEDILYVPQASTLALSSGIKKVLCFTESKSIHLKLLKVLFGAAAFTVSNDRLAAVNFTRTIDLQPYTFMIERPREQSRALIFIRPFTDDMWIYIGVSVVIMAPILFLINRYSPFYTFHGLYDGQGLFRLDNCFWYMYATLVQQGGTKEPDADSARLVVTVWAIYVIVVVTTYSGNLVAFLTFPQIDNAVSTLDDLITLKDDMSWGYTKGTVLEEYFKSAEGKFKEIGELSRRVDAQDDVLYNRIRYDHYAFIEWKTNLLFTMKKEYMRTGTCDFSLGREEFYFENVAMPIPKDSPYIEKFNKEIKRMQLGGLIEKWKQDFWPKKDRCSSTAYGDNGETRTVSILDMQGSFYILLMGCLLALVILIFECALKRFIKMPD